MTDYTDYTLAELQEEAGTLEVGVVKGTNNPSKPTKTDYINAITKKFEYAEPEPKVEVAEKVEEAVVPKQSPAKLRKLDLFRKDRVTIFDKQSKPNEDREDELIPISWGNRLGTQTDFVSLNPEPQYVRKGALDNIRGVKMVLQTKGPNGKGVTKKLVPRFVVTDVTGLTQKELDELAAKQKVNVVK